MESGRNIKIGDVLLELGFITAAQLQAGLEYQKLNRKRIGDALVELGFITEKQKIAALAKRLSLASSDIEDLTIESSAIAKIPRQTAEKHAILPVRARGGILTVLTDDPMNFYGLEEARQISGMQLEIILTEKAPLASAISRHYSEIGVQLAAEKANIHAGKLAEAAASAPADDETPVINLLNSLVLRAWTVNASDIHIEPFEDCTQVRMRMDGTIVDYLTLDRNLHGSLIARIKVLSELDIAEHRLPQDGHARIQLGGATVNMRVSLIPTVFGEKAVLRILDGNAAVDYSGAFGMRPNDYEKFMKILQAPSGLVYITGPTGSGKTTTLYMALEYLSRKSLNISTIEDPVEKNIRRVNQMQVNASAGLTFEAGLRALLRQDPDVIMVGETRDPETASISVRAAITGHLVLSTLHTSDACGSVARLLNMGVEPYLLADSLAGVVAQRLLRKVCPHCSLVYAPSEEEIRLLGIEAEAIRKARGCHLCSNTGYRGRCAVHEILTVDEGVRRLISAAASGETIKEHASKCLGLVTLKEAAARLVAEGVTTMEEF